MNSKREIQQAYADFKRTRFGSWDWQRKDPVHAREKLRFSSNQEIGFDSSQSMPASELNAADAGSSPPLHQEIG